MKENKNIDKPFETSYVIADYTQKLEQQPKRHTKTPNITDNFLAHGRAIHKHPND
jgi:hypothetical protein